MVGGVGVVDVQQGLDGTGIGWTELGYSSVCGSLDWTEQCRGGAMS